MEVKIELDLPTIISAAVSAERIQPLVDKAIAEAVKDAIGEATGYRSEFREKLRAQIAEAMPHGLCLDDIAKFQYVLNTAVTEAVHGTNAETIRVALHAAANAVIPEVPARIKLSELIEAARNGFHKEEYEGFYANFEPSEYGGGMISLDSDEGCRDQYRARIRFQFNKDGDVFALHLDGRDVTPKVIPKAIGKFEGLLLSMYTGRTTIECDCDEDDVRYAAHPKED